jgi:hypothetical protein
MIQKVVLAVTKEKKNNKQNDNEMKNVKMSNIAPRNSSETFCGF